MFNMFLGYLAIMISLIALPMVLHYGFKLRGKNMKTVLGVNIFSFFSALAAMTVLMWSGSVFAAPDAEAVSANGMAFIAAALSTGLSGIGSGIAVALSSSAAMGALSENPDIMGKALIFVALAEGIALYGFIISFMILSRI